MILLLRPCVSANVLVYITTIDSVTRALDRTATLFPDSWYYVWYLLLLLFFRRTKKIRRSQRRDMRASANKMISENRKIFVGQREIYGIFYGSPPSCHNLRYRRQVFGLNTNKILTLRRFYWSSHTLAHYTRKIILYRMSSQLPPPHIVKMQISQFVIISQFCTDFFSFIYFFSLMPISFNITNYLFKLFSSTELD